MSLYLMQSSGDTFTPMKLELYVRVPHMIICPFIVLGWWEFPRMGVGGAALINVIAQAVGGGLGLWYFFTGRTRLHLSLSDFRIDYNMMWRILKIGIPASIMTLQRAFSNIILTWLLVRFGTHAVSAHSLGQNVERFLLLPGGAMGMGAGVLVGQNLGANQPERAARSGWMAIGIVEAFMIACSVVIFIWAESIISIFNAEPELVRLGSVFLRIATAGYLVMGLVIVLQNCISSGAGDTLPVMLISLAMIWVVQLPLAYFLPRITEFGVYGVRWAIVAGTATGAVAYLAYFRLGRWKRKRV
jgi:putative MATE family efflux protein